MKLEEQIKTDLKEAMKSGDAQTRDVLRMLTSEIKNEAIKAQRELDDQAVLAVVRRSIKGRKDAMEQFIAGGRADLAEKEKSELPILEKYMPDMMSEAEIEAAVKDVLVGMDDAAKKNFGLVMKEVMNRTAGRADGSQVSAVVKKTLIG